MVCGANHPQSPNLPKFHQEIKKKRPVSERAKNAKGLREFTAAGVDCAMEATGRSVWGSSGVQTNGQNFKV